MGDWQVRANKRRDARATKDPNEVPKPTAAVKDTKRWCKGKEGVEHKPVCRNFTDAKSINFEFYRASKILICEVCGKELDSYHPRVFFGVDVPPKPAPAWVVQDDPTITEPLHTFLKQMAPKMVVIGSVARGVRWPKDLDFLWDMDSDKTKEEIKSRIKALGLTFESPFVGAWTFRNYGWMVELIGTNYGPNYRVVRRRARKQTICGIEFFVAHDMDNPRVVKDDPKKWVTWPGGI